MHETETASYMAQKDIKVNVFKLIYCPLYDVLQFSYNEHNDVFDNI